MTSSDEIRGESSVLKGSTTGLAMEAKKIYVTGDDQGTIVCDSCGKWKTANVARYVSLNKPVKIRCSCGASFSVKFEKRKFYRKKVRLHGTCFIGRRREEPISIEDISAGGLGFRMNKGAVEKGDTLNIEFTLDDKARSTISEDVIVKSVKDRLIGAEFTGLCEHSKKVLGFYLLP
ncbi:MAG TPA: PilZ domain-containing protein [Desulfobacterales bacterium]|nr:PilZ domain-containing protein [Desulfobacterales bacterium]